MKIMSREVDFVLSEASPDDAEGLVTLINDIHKEFSINQNEESCLLVDEEKEIINQHRNKSSGQIILAKDKVEGLLIGSSSVTRHPHVSSHVFELNVFVHKLYWDTVVGRALLKAATEAAKNMGAERLEAMVFSHNHRAVRMYERAGFVCEGLKKWACQTAAGSYHDSMLVALILNPEVANSDPEEGTTIIPRTGTKPVECEIMPAAPDDSTKMVEYLDVISGENEVTHVDTGDTFWMTKEEEFIREKSLDKKNVLFVNAWEKSSGCLIGYASAFRQPREMSHIFELGISVRKDFWGIGIGRALFLAIVKSTIVMGAVKLELIVHTNNHRAIDMYRKFGFKEEAVARKAVKTSSGLYRDCMHMALFSTNQIAKDIPTHNMNASKGFTMSLGGPSDAADWVSHINKVAGETNFCSIGKNGYCRTVEEEEHHIGEMIQSGNGVYVLARDDRTGELVGRGKCIRIKNRRSDHVFDLGLTVLRAHWSRGIGTNIMHKLIQETKKLGGRKILLEFHSDNTRAQKLYERLGFYVEGRLRDQIMVEGQYLDLILMAKILH